MPRASVCGCIRHSAARRRRLVAVFDGAGHDLHAGHDTALAITAIRLARRHGVTDLAALAAHADDLLTAQPGPTRFVTAALATDNSRTTPPWSCSTGRPTHPGDCCRPSPDQPCRADGNSREAGSPQTTWATCAPIHSSAP